MPSVIDHFEYDIFISYRHNDNLDGWVTDFVNNLEKELKATLKDSITIYFDKNPHDGLLETHSVDKSLEGKLKCLIFIPIISQTYCDTKSFAWQHEFCAFNRMAREDQFGRDIKLSNGNVASRILPVKIHDLDAEDKALLEKELGGVLRAVDFIYKESGVNRPLTVEDKEEKNLNGTRYRNQVNKVANAIKELIVGMQHASDDPKEEVHQRPSMAKPKLKRYAWAAIFMLLLSLSGFVYYYFGGFGNRISPAPVRSIAVIPFVNMSKDPDQEYFSDGMTDEVLNRLFKIGGDLKVISRTSSMKFKGAKLTAKEIASQLGVANILEGSVQKIGNQLKITVQLIDANSDNHLWSETYEREFKDVFSIQAGIASAVARELRVRLSPELKNDLTMTPTKSRLAYEFYLKGRDFMSKDDDEASVESAILMFSKAIQEDSMFGLAYADRAHAHLYYYWLRYEDSEKHKDLGHQDIEALQKLDPDLPELKLALAYWHYYGFRQYDEALALLKELQAKTPNSPDLHNILAAIYRRQGKWTESIVEFEKAISLDPLNTLIIGELSRLYELLHRYNDALATAKRGVDLMPDQEPLRWEILVAQLYLHHDLNSSIKSSGLTENVSWMNNYLNYCNRKYSLILNDLRKRKSRITSNQGIYSPITLDYANIYFILGSRPLAKAYADSTITFLLKKLPDMREDHRIYSSLGMAYAISGNEEKAIEYGSKAMAALPVSLDHYSGTSPEARMIDIYLYLGKYELALDKIERLLSIPSELGVGFLLIDPKYEPLRNLPRFKKLVEKYKDQGKG